MSRAIFNLEEDEEGRLSKEYLFITQIMFLLEEPKYVDEIINRFKKKDKNKSEILSKIWDKVEFTRLNLVKPRKRREM